MSVVTAIISAVLQGVGTELSAAGDIQQGKAIKRAEELNASLAIQDAELQEATSKARAEETRAEARRTRSAQRARFAKAGIDPDQGSPLLLQLEAISEGEKAALQEEFFGAAASAKFRTEAAQRTTAGRVAQKRANAQAGQTLLTGIAGSVQGGTSAINFGAIGRGG